MGVNCSTECFPLAGSVIVPGDADDVYRDCDSPITTPRPLNIVITPRGSEIFDFSVALNADDPFNTIPLGTIDYHNAKGVTGVAGVSFPQVTIQSASYVAVQLNENIQGISGDLYKSGDKYILRHIPCARFDEYRLIFDRDPTLKIEAEGTNILTEADSIPVETEDINIPTEIRSVNPTEVFRVSRKQEGTCQKDDLLPLNGSDTIIVPRIKITAQTNVDGTDVGDAVFEIYDEFQYYERCNIHNNRCEKDRSIQPSKLKTTKLRKCCLYMVSVLRGEGKTAYEKVWNLYVIYHWDIGLTFIKFAQYLMLYALTKYILCYILYGHFNVKYLLRKYNERFLHDLRKSRFCAFSEYFDSPQSPGFGYAKYFKHN